MMHDHAVVLVPIATGLSLLATFWGITWKMGQDCDKKIGTIYRRFDEYKAHLEDTHVRREVCELHVHQISNDLQEVKADVKALLKLANGKSK